MQSSRVRNLNQTELFGGWQIFEKLPHIFTLSILDQVWLRNIGIHYSKKSAVFWRPARSGFNTDIFNLVIHFFYFFFFNK